MRIVCDTNVLLSGLIWAGTPGRIWERVESGVDRLFVSRGILDELARVLAYPRVARVLDRRSLRARDVLGAVVRAADVVWPRPLSGVVVDDDPDDDAILSCAAAAAADFVISGDTHLLSLKRWSGIRVVTPSSYLDLVAGRTKRRG